MQPSPFFVTGQAVQVKILSIDTVKCRLTLSIKQATPDPLRVGKEQLTWTQSIAMSPEVSQLLSQAWSQCTCLQQLRQQCWFGPLTLLDSHCSKHHRGSLGPFQKLVAESV